MLFAPQIGRFASQVLRVDLKRGVAATLTDVRDYNIARCWSPDDRTLAMSSILSGGHEEIRLLPADGSGPPRLVPTSAAQFKSPEAWSPDGRSIVINQIMPGTGRDLFVIDAELGGAPRPVAIAPGNQFLGALSADGRWLAYGSEETGKWQVFVCRFPDGANKLQLTAAGGADAHWTRGDGEIVYVGEDRRSFYAIPFEPGREPGPDAARLLFRLPYSVSMWDVTKDGERFLVLAPERSPGEPSTTFIVDWPAMLR